MNKKTRFMAVMMAAVMGAAVIQKQEHCLPWHRKQERKQARQ